MANQILTDIRRWFASGVDAEEDFNQPSFEEVPYRVDWIRSIPFIALHLMCLGIIFVGWSLAAVAVAISLYFARMFFVTGFYHRYFSHKTFKTSRFMQLVLALLGTSCTQKGPLWWAANHRLHHKHSDGPEDPHSPHQHGFFWSHIGWITDRRNFPTRVSLVPDLASFRELRFLDRFDLLVPILMASSLFVVGEFLRLRFPASGTSGWQMLIWGFFVSTVVLFHGSCMINSVAHLIGKKKYDTGDESGNSFFLAFFTLGEGWHNNHHHYPATARQGFFWWELDITYYLLKIMSWLGLIWDLRPVPEQVRARIPQSRRS